MMMASGYVLLDSADQNWNCQYFKTLDVEPGFISNSHVYDQ